MVVPARHACSHSASEGNLNRLPVFRPSNLKVKVFVPPGATDRLKANVRLFKMPFFVEETKRADDHQLKGATYPILEVADGRLTERSVPMLNALNEVLRDDYIKDSMGGVARWNKVIEKHGLAFRLQVPHKAFHRRIGTLAGFHVTPDGRVVDEATWQASARDWLPTDEDRAYVASLMGRVIDRGRYANWIAPPVVGINRQPLDFEYIRFN